MDCTVPKIENQAVPKKAQNNDAKKEFLPKTSPTEMKLKGQSRVG